MADSPDFRTKSVILSLVFLIAGMLLGFKVTGFQPYGAVWSSWLSLFGTEISGYGTYVVFWAILAVFGLIMFCLLKNEGVYKKIGWSLLLLYSAFILLNPLPSPSNPDAFEGILPQLVQSLFFRDFSTMFLMLSAGLLYGLIVAIGVTELANYGGNKFDMVTGFLFMILLFGEDPLSKLVITGWAPQVPEAIATTVGFFLFYLILYFWHSRSAPSLREQAVNAKIPETVSKAAPMIENPGKYVLLLSLISVVTGAFWTWGYLTQSESILPTISLVVMLLSWFVMLIFVHLDIKVTGKNEFWSLVPFFFGGLGGLAYYVASGNPAEDKRLAPGKRPTKENEGGRSQSEGVEVKQKGLLIWGVLCVLFYLSLIAWKISFVLPSNIFDLNSLVWIFIGGYLIFQSFKEPLTGEQREKRLKWSMPLTGAIIFCLVATALYFYFSGQGVNTTLVAIIVGAVGAWIYTYGVKGELIEGGEPEMTARGFWITALILYGLLAYFYFVEGMSNQGLLLAGSLLAVALAVGILVQYITLHLVNRWSQQESPSGPMKTGAVVLSILLGVEVVLRLVVLAFNRGDVSITAIGPHLTGIVGMLFQFLVMAAILLTMVLILLKHPYARTCALILFSMFFLQSIISGWADYFKEAQEIGYILPSDASSAVDLIEIAIPKIVWVLLMSLPLVYIFNNKDLKKPPVSASNVQIADWMSAQVQRGFNEKRIKEQLLSHNYRPEVIDASIKLAKESKKKGGILGPPPMGEAMQIGTEHFELMSVIAIILAFLLPPAGIVLGIISLVRIKHNSHLKGKSLAVSAIIVGAIVTLLALLFILYVMGLATQGIDLIAAVQSGNVQDCLKLAEVYREVCIDTVAISAMRSEHCEAHQRADKQMKCKKMVEKVQKNPELTGTCRYLKDKAKQTKCFLGVMTDLMVGAVPQESNESQRIPDELSPGLNAMDEGKFIQAAEFFSRLSKGRPNDPQVFYQLGVAYSAMEKYNESVNVLEKAKTLAPEDEDIRRQLGIAFVALGRYAEAVPELAWVFERSPQTPNLGFLLGNSYFFTGQYDKAIDALSRNVPDTPKYDQLATYYLGLAHYHAGHIPQAREAFTRASQMLPGSPIASKAEEAIAQIEAGAKSGPVLFDASICKGIKDSKSKENCYLVATAKETMPLSVCDTVEKAFYKLLCFLNIALPAKDTQICNLGSNQDSKMACEAIIKNDPTGCQNIQFGHYKNVCLFLSQRPLDDDACKKMDDYFLIEHCLAVVGRARFPGGCATVADQATNACKFYEGTLRNEEGMCDKITSDTVIADRCYLNVRIISDDTSVCKKIKNLHQRAICVTYPAAPKPDVALCEEIKDVDAREGCWISVAAGKKSLPICEKIENPSAKDACIAQVGGAKQDLSLCGKVRDSHNIYECIRGVAVGKKDLSICDQIQELFWKESCYEDVAGETRNASICTKLPESRRESCLGFVEYMKGR